MKLPFTRYFPPLAWAGVILVLSSIPEPLETAPSDVSTFLLNLRVLGVGGVTLVSFLIHFALYLVLGFLMARAVAIPGWVDKDRLLLDLALCVLFGFLDELYQLTVPGRGFEWVDLLADVMGSALGIWIKVVAGSGYGVGGRK